MFGDGKFVKCLCLGVLAIGAWAQPPNIIFIYSDDHAQQAISCYGSQVNQTPHMDRLAREGVRFEHAMVGNSICTPSRASLLTGQYSHRNGVPVFNRFDGQRDNVAKHLQAGGYHTGMIGKWHLGSDPTGFDRWIVLPGQGSYINPQFLIEGKQLTIQGHCTEITTQLGLEWLATRPKDKPFFLMLHQKAPHRHWLPDARNKELFKERTFVEPATLWDDYATRPAALPANRQTIAKDLTRHDLKLVPPDDLTGQELNHWLRSNPDQVEVDGKSLTGKELVQWQYRRYMQDYLACVQGVDDCVGAVLEYLDQNDLADNTVVFYSSDNGWYLGELGLYDKRFMYEPGMHVPLLVRGPGLKSQLVPEQLVMNIDLAPTFLELAGLPLDLDVQGHSLVPLMRGENPPAWRQSVYYRYYHDPGHHNTAAHYGVRTTTHKLVYYWKKDAYEMFDLVRDPNEQHNMLFDPVEAKEPTVARLFNELKAEIARLQKLYGDDGQFADAADWPKNSADGPFGQRERLGLKSVREAIQAITQAPEA